MHTNSPHSSLRRTFAVVQLRLEAITVPPDLTRGKSARTHSSGKRDLSVRGRPRSRFWLDELSWRPQLTSENEISSESIRTSRYAATAEVIVRMAWLIDSTFLICPCDHL